MSLHTELHDVDLRLMRAIAWQLAQTLRVGDAIFLRGGLGAGKTTFAQMLVESIDKCAVTRVTSPTFNIVHLYDIQRDVNGIGGSLKVWHFDLYRIQDVNELDHLGIEDAVVSGVSIVEWPDILERSYYWQRQSIVSIFLDFAVVMDCAQSARDDRNVVGDRYKCMEGDIRKVEIVDHRDGVCCWLNIQKL